MSTLRKYKSKGFNSEVVSEHAWRGDGLHHNYGLSYAFYEAVRSVLRDDPKARVYGLELEVPGSSYVSPAIRDKLDKLVAIRKDDGSLRDYDVEFNFPPLTAEYIRRSKILTKVRDVMMPIGGDPTCEHYYDEDDDGYDGDAIKYGIHIHSNAAWMKRHAQHFIVSFVRRNPLFFRWLSGRTGYSGYYCPDFNMGDRLAACTTDLGTIEYRMFRSTYDQRELNVWLSCIKAIEDWAHSIDDDLLPYMGNDLYGPKLTWRDESVVALEQFFAYVRATKGKYPGLRRTLKAYTADRATCATDDMYDYDRRSLYAHINSIFPARQRKVIERAQLPLPLAA
jgi:hypothetical protein